MIIITTKTFVGLLKFASREKKKKHFKDMLSLMLSIVQVSRQSTVVVKSEEHLPLQYSTGNIMTCASSGSFCVSFTGKIFVYIPINALSTNIHETYFYVSNSSTIYPPISKDS